MMDEKEEEKQTERQLGKQETKRGREKYNGTEEESNHLKGLKVSVRLTHCPAAKMNARVSSSCVCRMKDEHNFSIDLEG